MQISIITLFPNLFESFLRTSIIGRAVKKGLVNFELIDLREFGKGTHKSVDDKPYGGGAGMILRADVLEDALKSALPKKGKNTKVVFLSPSGEQFNQGIAKQFSSLDYLILICGHYEGIDQRFIDEFVDLEVSIGDYVLTGGEIPAMVLVDASVRLIKGVLEKEEAILNESFENNLLEHPQYTRPESFKGQSVPAVLISGNHKNISEWRKQKSLEKTKQLRPDLLTSNEKDQV